MGPHCESNIFFMIQQSIGQGVPGDFAEKTKDRQWKTGAVGKFIGERVANRINSGPENESMPEMSVRVIDSFERRITGLLPDHRDELSGIIASIRGVQFGSKEELAETITGRVTQFIVDRVSLDELEKGIRDNDVAEQGWKPLSRVLCYEIEEGDRIRLRVPKVFIQNPIEFGSLFILGLKELSKVLKSDTALQKIKTVIGSSRLIYAFRRDMEAGGFTVTVNDEQNKIATAEIRAEKLTEKYSPEG